VFSRRFRRADVGDRRRPPRYLRAGDVVEIDVHGVPTLRNPLELERR
jgi:2-keto-4-pentenoate hydratase/2-oxohepta-3-ene-1,7-dioic acid hydratase in catechol pathway